METGTKPRPQWRDTTAARSARTRAKHERWAAEMREAGWSVATPEEMRDSDDV